MIKKMFKNCLTLECKTAYCRIKSVVSVAKRIRQKDDIFNVIDLGIKNRFFKSNNSKIKATVKIGYGFLNIGNLIPLLMLSCSDLK